LDIFFRTAKRDVEDRLKEIIENCDESNKLKYFLSSGKRLRPLLCLLAFGACEGYDYSKALNLAAAIELHHCASLVHDDIIDGDVERRSEESYFKRFGVEDAILTGHKAIVLGFKCVLDHDPIIVRTLFDTWDQSLEGEIADISSRQNIKSLLPTADRSYFEVMINKTASLFAGASKVGSQEAKAPVYLQNLFYEYGKNIGLAYQLADDMHDIGNSYERLPLAWIISHFSGDIRKSLVESIDVDGMAPHKALMKLGIETEPFFIKEIADAVSTAETIVKNSSIHDSRFKEMLLSTPSYMINKFME
jgi:geranylgeranyl pyrophosphate synthase